jgi:predicted DNA-binding WGR domain protein
MRAQRQLRLIPAAFGPLPTTLCLVSINPAKNRYRYYRLSHQRTLWDEDVLVQTWGRLGTDGRSRLCYLDAPEQVQREMTKLLRRRLQHGYQVTEPCPVDEEPEPRASAAFSGLAPDARL